MCVCARVWGAMYLKKMKLGRWNSVCKGCMRRPWHGYSRQFYVGQWFLTGSDFVLHGYI